MNKTDNKEQTPVIIDRIRSEEEQVLFFEHCLEGYSKAVSNTQEYDFYYKIAGFNLKISFAGKSLIKLLTPALEHLRVEVFDNADFSISVWDSDSTSVKNPERPCEWNDFTDRGDIWGFNSQRIKTAFHWIECSVNVLDHERNSAVFWVQNNRQLPFWVYASPFRTIIHWFMEKRGYQLLHAAAVGTEEGAVLITGKGGVGKSTTALSCLNSGFKYLSDDYLITKIDPEPTVYTLYNTAKLNSDNVHKFPSLSKLVDNSEKLENEKAVLFLYPDKKDQIVDSLPIKAIFTPVIKDKKETSINAAKKLLVERSIAFTTMSQLPNVGKHTHDYISRLTSRTALHTLHLGSDFDKIAQSISSYLENPSEYSKFAEESKNKKNTKKSKPLVTAVIPVHNGEKFICEALANIKSQHYPSLEIIIVDDGSTDNSKKIVTGLKDDIRYFSLDENSGPSFARNRGIRDASGEFIVFLDVDDLWPENNLDILVKEITSSPGLDVVHGYAQVMKYNKKINDYEYVGGPKDSFRHYIGAGIYRKTVFRKVGLFNEILRFGEDEDWYRRAFEMGVNIKRIDDTTLFVRRHESNMTRNKNLVELNTFKVLKMSIDRKKSKAEKT